MLSESPTSHRAMITTQRQITDTWVEGSWDNYLQLLKDPAYTKAKGYYFHPYFRIEMLPVGFDHSKDHALISMIISLYAILKNLLLNLLDSCTFRKAEIRECQPDLACYINHRVTSIPQGTNIVDLNIFPPPDLVIEIGKTTILDDLTVKRALYEQMNVQEYWVVDVEQSKITAWQMIARGSQQIEYSVILPGLSMGLIETALTQSRTMSQSEVGAWIMKQI